MLIRPNYRTDISFTEKQNGNTKKTLKRVNINRTAEGRTLFIQLLQLLFNFSSTYMYINII